MNCAERCCSALFNSAQECRKTAVGSIRAVEDSGFCAEAGMVSNSAQTLSCRADKLFLIAGRFYEQV